jgi:hypothetical protein
VNEHGQIIWEGPLHGLPPFVEWVLTNYDRYSETYVKVTLGSPNPKVQIRSIMRRCTAVQDTGMRCLRPLGHTPSDHHDFGGVTEDSLTSDQWDRMVPSE